MPIPNKPHPMLQCDTAEMLKAPTQRVANVRLERPSLKQPYDRVISVNGEAVGYMQIQWRKDSTADELTEEFEYGEQASGFIRSHFELPERFDCRVVYDLRVDRKMRGQGIARKALQLLRKDTPVLIALQIGPANGARMSMETRREVYRKMGFKIFETKPLDAAFLWLP